MMVLAYASDLATGHSRDFALRSCVLPMRIADRAGLPVEDRRNAFRQSLLRYVGCNADTHRRRSRNSRSGRSWRSRGASSQNGVARSLTDESTRQPFYAARVRIDFGKIPKEIASSLVRCSTASRGSTLA
jgi:hypothetical protein